MSERSSARRRAGDGEIRPLAPAGVAADGVAGAGKIDSPTAM